MTLPRALLTLACVLFLSTISSAATRKECKPSKCGAEIDLCRAACTTGSKKQQRSCRKRCKRTVTKACRNDLQTCGGGPPGGQCAAYTPACAARSLEPLRDRNATCTGASGAAQPCDYDHDTKFRVRTPWRTHAGECCVIDTCRGTTAFGIYDHLALPPIIPPESSPLTAPVTVTVQALSTYFQRPSTGPGIPGQWGHTAATILGLSCSTPPSARVISTAGGPIVAFSKTDYLSYDTHPVPSPTGTWDFLTLSGSGTSLQFAPPHPPLLPPCGSTPDTSTCQAKVFALENITFIGDLNPVTEVLSERIGIDQLCDDTIVASAEGTFRRRDGSECSVKIYAQAKIGCDTSADCLAPEVCTTTDPLSPTDFGNAFPGWTGQSCVIPAQ